MVGPNTFGEILVVDDNPGDVRLTKEMLKEAGYDPTVHEVNDGPSAVDFIRQQGAFSNAPRPDAIFLDLKLGKMNGDEVLREINDKVEDVPVIILSGSHGFDAIELEDVEEEVDACLEKPIEPADAGDLVQCVDND